MNFSDAMDKLPMEELRDILTNPRPVDQDTFTCMVGWMGVVGVSGDESIERLTLACGAFKTLSEARRKIKQGGVKWNGVAVSEGTPVDWIWPGWGILALGKKKHWLLATLP